MFFAKPEFLYGLTLIPILWLGWRFSESRRKAAMRRLGDTDLIERLSASVNWRGRRWVTFLTFVALSLMLFSLARPQWGSEVQNVEQQGIEIMVALDVSQSMMAEDIKPNRLSRAKLDITDLMISLEGNEIGLVLFSGDSFIQFPLTFDIATARNFLDNAHSGMISRPGTDIGDAIETAMRGFNDRLATQKVIVVITDGENHEAGALEAAQEAAEAGILIYTIGIGSPTGEPIPRYNDEDILVGFKRDQNGETILSRLDEVTLQQISIETGGQYFRSTPSGREIDALVADLNEIEKSELEGRFETRRIERFQWFLSLGLVALIVKELIPDRKKTV
ncbi:MAG: VWA domain-containing protein [Chloroflexota bacterium]